MKTILTHKAHEISLKITFSVSTEKQEQLRCHHNHIITLQYFQRVSTYKNNDRIYKYSTVKTAHCQRESRRLCPQINGRAASRPRCAYKVIIGSGANRSQSAGIISPSAEAPSVNLFRTLYTGDASTRLMRASRYAAHARGS